MFDRRRIWDIIFQEGYKRFVMSYVINITVDYCFPEARLGREKTARGYRSWGNKYMIVKERHGTTSLMARNSTGRLGGE